MNCPLRGLMGGLAIGFALFVARPALGEVQAEEPEATVESTHQVDEPTAEPSLLPDPEMLKEKLIGLLPGETLETVARSLAEKRVSVRLSTDRAFVVVRVPLG